MHFPSILFHLPHAIVIHNTCIYLVHAVRRQQPRYRACIQIDKTVCLFPGLSFVTMPAQHLAAGTPAW